MWSKFDTSYVSLPLRINSAAIKNKSSNSQVNKLLVSSDQKKLAPDGKKLWDALLKLRSEIVKHSGTYSIRDDFYSINPYDINVFKDEKDLEKKIELMFAKSKINRDDEERSLIELYRLLTKPQFVDFEGESIHWINYTFKCT